MGRAKPIRRKGKWKTFPNISPKCGFVKDNRDHLSVKCQIFGEDIENNMTTTTRHQKLAKGRGSRWIRCGGDLGDDTLLD